MPRAYEYYNPGLVLKAIVMRFRFKICQESKSAKKVQTRCRNVQKKREESVEKIVFLIHKKIIKNKVLKSTKNYFLNKTTNGTVQIDALFWLFYIASSIIP